MYQLSRSQPCAPGTHVSKPSSGHRRPCVLLAATNAGPGGSPNVRSPMSPPMPQLKPLPQGNTPQLPRPHGAPTPGMQQPGLPTRPPMAPQQQPVPSRPPMAPQQQPGLPIRPPMAPQQQQPAARPPPGGPPPPMRPARPMPPGMAPPQGPMRPPPSMPQTGTPPGAPAMRPPPGMGSAGMGPPGMAPLRQPQQAAPVSLPSMPPTPPQQQQQAGLQPPPLARPPLGAPGAAAAAVAAPPAPSGGAVAPPPPRQQVGLQPPPSMQRPAPPMAQPGGLQPKPQMMPQAPAMPPLAAGAAAPGMLPRPMLPQQPTMGSIGLQRPAMPAGLQSVTLTRPMAPQQQQQSEQQQQQQQRRGRDEGSEEGKKVVTRTVKAGKLGMLEVVEEEEDVPLDDEEEEAEAKGKKGKGKKGKKEKVTAEMKRKARQQREAERAEKAAKEVKEKEEIFEVGEEGMSLEGLAEAIQQDPSDIVRALFMKGIMLSMNQVLDKNTVKLVGQEFGLLVVDKEKDEVSEGAKKKNEFLDEDDFDEAVARPPVVTVMGHVDHGKTSLLDFIRKAKVAAGEAGGITQAIGAYNVDVDLDDKNEEKRTICFLDTPGHEAFSAMRARGARVTDVAIIIVAADDGVQPQTREAISHAQAAGVPIVVAVNKIDKPGADPDRAKQGLLELNLVPEEWGGSTPMVNVSAKKGIGIDELLQTVVLVAEEQMLMANPKKPGAGTVIEAHLDKRRGAVATLLVQGGTLRVGDIVCAGACYGKVRSMTSASKSSIAEAGPSIAVQMVGLSGVPQAGDEFKVYKTEGEARTAANAELEGLRTARMAEMTASGSMVTLSSLATYDEDSEVLQRMNLIIKGDTSGMVEAIKGALSALPQESVVLRYLLCAAGDVTISDIDLAAASGGMVVGFNLEPDEAVLAHAKRLGVAVNTYRVIYNLIDDVKAAMEGKLRAVEERVPSGTAEVKAVFGSGKRKVAGCMVTAGKLIKGQQIEVRRGKEVVFNGKMESLRRVKDDVDEVQEGVECGLGAAGFTSWAEGDIIECFRVVTKAQKLEEAKATTAVDLATIG